VWGLSDPVLAGNFADVWVAQRMVSVSPSSTLMRMASALHLNTQIPAFVPHKYDVNSSYLPHIYFLFTSPNAHNYLTFSHNYVSAHHIYFLSISYLLPHTTYLPDFCS
jgi:hypothetical protein